MVLFIRNNHDNSIVDLEIYEAGNDNSYIELYPEILIGTYSKFLLENIDRSEEIIRDFDEINELRGWLWEYYFMGRQNTAKEFNIVLELVRNKLKEIANKYNLYYVED